MRRNVREERDIARGDGKKRWGRGLQYSDVVFKGQIPGRDNKKKKLRFETIIQ